MDMEDREYYARKMSMELAVNSFLHRKDFTPLDKSESEAIVEIAEKYYKFLSGATDK